MFLFLTVVQAIIAAALVGVVLMQRSEGGGLGIGGGGSPGGLMSARGAADFLTRTTKWLAVLFVVLAIVIGAVAVGSTTGRDIDTSLDRTVAPAQPDPLAPVTAPGAGLDAPVVDAPAATATASPAPSDDPLADVAQ
ncbi:MAG TPA: preprotein translocase subunit SecG [Croceibacterium sp.]|nr:preprotein translocase subunit SecG [Croceibacterium sp.]